MWSDRRGREGGREKGRTKMKSLSFGDGQKFHGRLPRDKWQPGRQIAIQPREMLLLKFVFALNYLGCTKA